VGASKGIVQGVIIGLIVNALWAAFAFLPQFFGIQSLVSLLNIQLPFALMIGAVIIAFSIVVMVLRTRRPGMSVSVIPRRPHPATMYTFNHFGVKWHILFGGGNFFGTQNYAFVDGDPHCPDCDYEMNYQKKGILLKKFYWKCEMCGKQYKCPVSHPYEAGKIVERLLEADIRRNDNKND
jgi:ribosomal protein L37AE/L43A